MPYGAEMRPPIEVELWKPVDNTRHVLAVTVSFEAAEKAYQEAVANLRLGEVVRLRMPSVRCCFLPTSPSQRCSVKRNDGRLRSALCSYNLLE